MALDELIESLCTECPASRPLAFRWKWLAAIAALFAYLGTALWLHGMRPDVEAFWSEPVNALEIGLLLLLLLTALHATMLSGYPDCRGHRAQMRWFWAPLTALAAFYTVLLLREPDSMLWGEMRHGLLCCMHISAVALLPAIGLTLLLKRHASTHPCISGMAAAVAAFALGALVLRHHEPVDWTGHILLWHYLPIALFAALGAWLGPKLLKW